MAEIHNVHNGIIFTLYIILWGVLPAWSNKLSVYKPIIINFVHTTVRKHIPYHVKGVNHFSGHHPAIVCSMGSYSVLSTIRASLMSQECYTWLQLHM